MEERNCGGLSSREKRRACGCAARRSCPQRACAPYQLRTTRYAGSACLDGKRLREEFIPRHVAAPALGAARL